MASKPSKATIATVESVTKMATSAMAIKLSMENEVAQTNDELAKKKASRQDSYNTSLAACFVGTDHFTVEDVDAVLSASHILTFGEPEPNEKTGKREIASGTMAEYRLLAKAGAKGVYSQARTAIEGWHAIEDPNQPRGDRQRNLLNLIRDHYDPERLFDLVPESVAKGIEARARTPYEQAKSAIKGFARKMEKKFSVKIDTKPLLLAVEKLKDLDEAKAEKSKPVESVNVSVPKVETPKVEAPSVAAAVAQPANTGFDLQAIMASPGFALLPPNVQGATIAALYAKHNA